MVPKAGILLSPTHKTSLSLPLPTTLCISVGIPLMQGLLISYLDHQSASKQDFAIPAPGCLHTSTGLGLAKRPFNPITSLPKSDISTPTEVCIPHVCLSWWTVSSRKARTRSISLSGPVTSEAHTGLYTIKNGAKFLELWICESLRSSYNVLYIISLGHYEMEF